MTAQHSPRNAAGKPPAIVIASDIAWVKAAGTSLLADLPPPPAAAAPSSLLACAAVLQYLAEQRAHAASGPAASNLAGWSDPRDISICYDFAGHDGESQPVVVTQQQGSGFHVSVGGTAHAITPLAEASAGVARLQVDSIQETLYYRCEAGGRIELQWRGDSWTLDNRLAVIGGADAAAGGGAVVAPMHGHVVALTVAVGDGVVRGDTVAVIEAMKMEHRLSAAIGGTVMAIQVAPGAQVATGDIVLDILPD